MTEKTPLTAYRAMLAEGELRPDPIQATAIEKLESLHHRLKTHGPKRLPLLQELMRFRRRKETPPRGIYFHGDVGRGKTMVMDVFFKSAPVMAKRRVHFHAFMQDAHDRINRFRKARQAGGEDPVLAAANEIAETAWLLCFDEMEVRDVADAMILSRLFTQLIEQGVIVVATSNRAPDELYKGGLNRQLFLPFIELLKQELDIVHLGGVVDYRLARMIGKPVYLTPLGAAASHALSETFFELTDRETGEPDEIPHKGRIIKVPEQARGVARFAFADLCAQMLAAADYLAIAGRYHTLILDGIPALGPSRRDEARRFAMLIDVLYDNKIKLVCSAETTPIALYPAGDGLFEFARTASRLMEMQSADYIALPPPAGHAAA